MWGRLTGVCLIAVVFCASIVQAQSYSIAPVVGEKFGELRSLNNFRIADGCTATVQAEDRAEDNSYVHLINYRLQHGLPQEIGRTTITADGSTVSGIVHVADINRHGVVVGNAGEYPQERGYLYSEKGLAPFPGQDAQHAFVPVAINDHGVVAGQWTSLTTYETEPKLFSGRRYQNLARSGIDWVSDVNSHRAIVAAKTAGNPSQVTSVIGPAGGRYQAFRFPEGTLYPFASKLNDRGLVIGNGFFQIPPPGNGAYSRAFVWRYPQNPIDIGASIGESITVAADLNNQGRVIGSLYREAEHRFHAFIWDQVQGIRLLEALLSPADQKVYGIRSALSINSSGQIAAQRYLLSDPWQGEFNFDLVILYPSGSPYPCALQ